MNIYLTFILQIICTCSFYADEPVKVLYISFDGFRWDYLTKTDTPNFDYVIQRGVYAEQGIKNTMVTITAPNHISLATGLYEESHGIVGNNMYDPVFNETLSVFSDPPPNIEKLRKWYTNFIHEPIWITNQKAGDRYKSGSYFWPGAEAWYKEMPNRALPLNESVTYKQRIDGVINWFLDKTNPVNLAMLYFEEPDDTGHDYGPDSKEIISLIQDLDRNVMGYLIQQLSTNNLLDKVNMVITSDHGMTNVYQNQIIELDKYVEPSYYRYFDITPDMQLLPLPDKEDIIYNSLKNAHVHLHVYRKKDVPIEYHWSNNRRVMPIVLVCDEGWTIRQNATTYPLEVKGNHGFNNSHKTMRPFFLAHGPAFKKNFTATELFNNTDIYPLICKILGINPAPNNGSLENVQHLLEDNSISTKTRIKFSDENDELIAFWCVIVFGSISLVAILYCAIVAFLTSNKLHHKCTDKIGHVCQPMIITHSENAV